MYESTIDKSFLYRRSIYKVTSLQLIEGIGISERGGKSHSLELPATKTIVGRSGKELAEEAKRYGVSVAWIASSFKRRPEEVDHVDEDSVIRLEADSLSDIVRFLEGIREDG